MNKSTGILFLLVYVCGVTALLNENFLGPISVRLLIQQSSLFAIVGLAAAFVIITGGIDLSIGSMVGLIGCVLVMNIEASQGQPAATVVSNQVWTLGSHTIFWSALWLAMVLWDRFIHGRALRLVAPTLAIAVGIGLLFLASPIQQASIPMWGMWLTICGMSIVLAMQLGLIHGLLITKLNLQPFVVTLCGLMIYRGLCRWMTEDDTKGFGTEYNESLRLLATGRPCTIAFLMLVFGSLAVMGGLWMSARSFFSKHIERGLLGLALIALGSCAAVAGGARFYEGWEIEKGIPLVKVGGQELSTWTVKIPEGAEDLPAHVLALTGKYGSVAGFVILLAVGIGLVVANSRRLTRGRIIAGVIATICCVASFYLVYQASIIGNSNYERSDFLTDFSWLGLSDLSEKGYGRIKMIVVMVSLATMIGSIAWISRWLIQVCGDAIKGPLILLGGFAAFWWLGVKAVELPKATVTMPFLIMITLAAIAWTVLNKTVYGRYLLALGRNEEAARFSGINTKKMIVIAYVICAGLTGLFAVLFALDTNSVQPSEFGNFIELYAIAAAVLGGCSLRGGEGAIIGVIIGASIMRILRSALNLIGIPSQLEFTMIGAVILFGALVDEIVRRIIARRRTSEAIG